MKLLMFHAKEFWYKPYAQDAARSDSLTDSLVAFAHVEEGDAGRMEYATSRAIGHLKWLAGKNQTSKIILHSFAHLSSSKSDPETAGRVIQQIAEGLQNNFSVHIVPFGQFYEFSIHVAGQSLAKVFKEI